MATKTVQPLEKKINEPLLTSPRNIDIFMYN